MLDSLLSKLGKFNGDNSSKIISVPELSCEINYEVNILLLVRDNRQGYLKIISLINCF